MSNLRDDKMGDGSRCQLNCKFWNIFRTFGTGVVRNFKFWYTGGRLLPYFAH